VKDRLIPHSIFKLWTNRYKELLKVQNNSRISCGKRLFCELLFSVFAVIYFSILRVFFDVKVFGLENTSVKLSHFIEGIEYQIRNSSHRSSRKRVLRFIYWPIAYPNEFLASQYQEHLHRAFRSRYWYPFFEYLRLEKHKFYIEKYVNNTNIEKLRVFDAGSVSISFKESHLKFGAQLERQLFGSIGTDYVVFAYTSREYRKKVDVCLHPEDNLFIEIPDPETFKLMISNLRIKGLEVVRMGLNLDDSPKLEEAGLLVPRIKEPKSGFNDVWLSASCKLLVTAHTGAYFLAEAFNKPWVMTDAHTFAVPNWSSRGIVIFCLCWNEEEQKFASFQWMKDNPRWCYDSERVGKLWKVVHNTPEQITDVVTEKLARINGEWVDTVDDEELQKRFQRFVFGEVKDFSFLPRAGTKFLREHQHLLPD
jgi:putative glycosyltransferase (TIGR04372 family)